MDRQKGGETAPPCRQHAEQDLENKQRHQLVSTSHPAGRLGGMENLGLALFPRDEAKTRRGTPPSVPLKSSNRAKAPMTFSSASVATRNQRHRLSQTM